MRSQQAEIFEAPVGNRIFGNRKGQSSLLREKQKRLTLELGCRILWVCTGVTDLSVSAVLGKDVADILAHVVCFESEG